MGMFQWNIWKKFVKYMVESAKGKKIGISSKGRYMCMACYVVTRKGDNKALDIGNLVSYSMHGHTKVAHVYHPVVGSQVSGFCWWDTPEYEVYCIEDLSYWNVLEKYKVEEDRESVDISKYYSNIKNANLKYSEDIGLYL